MVTWPRGGLICWLCSFAHAQVDSPVFEPSHGAQWQATLGVDGGFGHGPQHLTCLVWADSARYMSSCSTRLTLPSFGGREGKTETETSATITKEKWRV